MNRPIDLDKLECYIKNVKYELKKVLKKIDEKITEPVRLKYTTPHYCPYCGELSLSEPHEIIKCSSCDMRFRLAKVQKEYPPIADLDDIDIMEIEADEHGNVDLAKIEDVNEIEQNSSVLQPVDFFVCLFNVIGKSTKTITFRHARKIRDKVTELMSSPIHIPWTRNEIYNTLNMSPDMFEIDGRNAAVNWVGPSCVDAWNAIKDLQLYSEETVYDLEEAMEKAVDIVGVVRVS